MKKKNERPSADNLRLDPEKRLCPSFDNVGVALYPVASKEDMGVRVVDNFCEEHIM